MPQLRMLRGMGGGGEKEKREGRRKERGKEEWAKSLKILHSCYASTGSPILFYMREKYLSTCLRHSDFGFLVICSQT